MPSTEQPRYGDPGSDENPRLEQERTVEVGAGDQIPLFMFGRLPHGVRDGVNLCRCEVGVRQRASYRVGVEHEFIVPRGGPLAIGLRGRAEPSTRAVLRSTRRRRRKRPCGRETAARHHAVSRSRRPAGKPIERPFELRHPLAVLPELPVDLLEPLVQLAAESIRTAMIAAVTIRRLSTPVLPGGHRVADAGHTGPPRSPRSARHRHCFGIDTRHGPCLPECQHPALVRWRSR